jgi:pilus assembly protein CpaB
MKPKTMILMVVAVGCGLAASYMTSRLLAERSAPAPVDSKVQVVVAKQKVSAMVLIKDPEKYFELKEFPDGLAPKKALRSLDEVKDQRLNKAVTDEEIVTSDHLLNKEQAGMPAELPPGTRAVAIKVNPESLAGGFVLPKTRVDVLFTLRGGPTEALTKVILQDMLVLAVDMVSQRDPQQPTMLGNTVTLAAKPEEASRLALAGQLGELRLTLRALGDNERIRLPASKYGEFDKPIRDGSTSEETQVVVAPPPPVPTLPKLESLPPPPEPKVEPKVEPKTEPKAEPKEVVKEKPKPEPEEPPVKTHTMVIINGEYVQKAVFVEDPQEGWKNGTVNREDGPPARKPEAAPRAPGKQAGS